MNNAAVISRVLPDHTPDEEWQRVLDVNVMSVVRSNRAFVPLLLDQGHGHIVNTASFAGLFGYSFDRLPAPRPRPPSCSSRRDSRCTCVRRGSV